MILQYHNDDDSKKLVTGLNPTDTGDYKTDESINGIRSSTLKSYIYCRSLYSTEI